MFADPATLFDGIKPFETLRDVVKLVAEQQDDIDCILCTGDLAQDASVEAYRQFYAVIEEFAVPQMWIPGNHDIRSHMQAAVGADNPCLRRALELGNWRIVMLSSNVEDQVYGRLEEPELDALDLALAQSERDGCFTLVCLHHNCVPVNAAWLQNHCLKNSDDFFAVLDRYSNVSGTLFGHIHQELSVSRNNALIMGSPSTCIQFHPDNDEFTIDDANPGYRWLDLHPDGSISSGVNRVEHKTYAIDFDSTGY